MARYTGKRGGAVELSANSTIPEHTERIKGHSELTNTVSHVLTITIESNIVDLFGIGASKSKKETENTTLFVHQVQFHGPQGEIIRAWANIDERGYERGDVKGEVP